MRSGGKKTHQLVVVRRPRTPELPDPPPLALERPVLHLLIRHELQRAVAHAEQRERRPTIKPAETLVTEYRAEPACRSQ